MLVYIVEVGEYSNKYIYGVVTDETLAYKMQHYLSVDTKENVSVSVYDTDAYDPNGYNLERTYFEVILDSKGNLISVEDMYDALPIKPLQFVEQPDGTMIFSIKAETEKKAIKIASERRAMYLARKYGIG